jgi:alpha-glucosidase
VSWWRDGVLYEIYPRSFADSNRDGIGDLPGIVERLDYLEWLGIAGIWLNPTFPSPNADWGYDVSDYLGVHPDLGELEDMVRLIAEAAKRGIRIVLDLVPNHTSIEHPWFRARPDYYLWADEPPNNWRSVFTGESAWIPRDGRFYLAHFTPEQADLDWWNPDLRAEFDRIIRFWLERGVAGFRIDVAHSLVKDRELRDNQPYRPGDPEWVRRMGSWNDRGMNQPETHDVFRHWRRIASEYGDTLLFGETYVDLDKMIAFYGNGDDELNLAHNVDFLKAPLEAATMSGIVETTERLIPEGAWPTYSGSNHDDLRLATRWAGGDGRKARAALLVLLGLRGTPFLYMGDELALENGEVAPERFLDPARPSRDPGRTPMPWTRDGDEWREPWLPLVDTSDNVEDQRADPGSTLHWVRDLIRRRPAWASEPYERLPAAPDVWAWRRGAATFVVNLSDEGAVFDGRSLEPWAAAVL